MARIEADILFQQAHGRQSGRGVVPREWAQAARTPRSKSRQDMACGAAVRIGRLRKFLDDFAGAQERSIIVNICTFKAVILGLRRAQLRERRLPASTRVIASLRPSRLLDTGTYGFSLPLNRGGDGSSPKTVRTPVPLPFGRGEGDCIWEGRGPG